MSKNEKGLLEKALLAWTDLNRAPLKAAGASKETLAMMDESVKAYLDGETLKGMGLALSSNAQGVMEIHKAAFYAVVDTLSISPPPPSGALPSSIREQQRRIRQFHD